MSLATELRTQIAFMQATGQQTVSLGLLALLIDKLSPPAAPGRLWVRFGCGHEQEVGPGDSAVTMLDYARDGMPCDACMEKVHLDAQAVRR